MSYRLRNCCLQGLKIRSMETKRFRLRLLISQARLGEKPLETRGAELCTGSTAEGAPLPGTTSSLLPVLWCQGGNGHREPVPGI